MLGDGRQRKCYLYVGDCIDAISCSVDSHRRAGLGVYNLGTDEVTDVDRSIAADLRGTWASSPRSSYTGGERGWVGDSPLILLDCATAACARLARRS